MIGTAGHIDHGKTALVRALTGVDTDRLPAEKQRGITIDLGFASLDLGEYRLAMVDVPGHERFIRNMLAGAAGLDLAMLVVAADDSVMPQTREHLEILRLLGLSGGLVVLTKCDLAEPGWIDLVEDDVRVAGPRDVPRRRGDRPHVGHDGAGDRRAEDDAAIALLAVGRRDDAGIFRMAIDRSFTVAGHGTVVTGTVVSGSVAVGDELEWLPAGRPVRVRGLHRHDRPVERVARGSRAAINLVGVHHAEVRRGHELAAPGYLEPSRILSVEIVESAAAAPPLRHRGRYKLHLGTAEVSAVLSLLDRDESHPGRARAGPGPAGRAGGRGPRPAVRPAQRESTRDDRRRAGAPAVGPPLSPPRSRRHRPPRAAPIARAARPRAGGPRVPRPHPVDRAAARRARRPAR